MSPQSVVCNTREVWLGDADSACSINGETIKRIQCNPALDTGRVNMFFDACTTFSAAAAHDVTYCVLDRVSRFIGLPIAAFLPGRDSCDDRPGCAWSGLSDKDYYSALRDSVPGPVKRNLRGRGCLVVIPSQGGGVPSMNDPVVEVVEWKVGKDRLLESECRVGHVLLVTEPGHVALAVPIISSDYADGNDIDTTDLMACWYRRSKGYPEFMSCQLYNGVSSPKVQKRLGAWGSNSTAMAERHLALLTSGAVLYSAKSGCYALTSAIHAGVGLSFRGEEEEQLEELLSGDEDDTPNESGSLSEDTASDMMDRYGRVTVHLTAEHVAAKKASMLEDYSNNCWCVPRAREREHPFDALTDAWTAGLIANIKSSLITVSQDKTVPGTVSTAVMLSSLPGTTDTLQTVFAPTGELVHHSYRKAYQKSQVTQILCSVKGQSAGHVVVINGGCEQISARCQGLIPTGAFQHECYGMEAGSAGENSVIQLRPVTVKAQLRHIMGDNADALIATDSYWLCRDAATIYGTMLDRADGTENNVINTFWLNMISTQLMRQTILHMTGQCVALTSNRPDVQALDATVNAEEHQWYQVCNKMQKGAVTVVNKGSKKQLSFEFERLNEALQSSFNMQTSQYDAYLPTVIGRTQDLDAESVVGLSISEVLSRVYDIPYGNWMQQIDSQCADINLVFPTYQLLRVRNMVTCYNSSVLHEREQIKLKEWFKGAERGNDDCAGGAVCHIASSAPGP